MVRRIFLISIYNAIDIILMGSKLNPYQAFPDNIVEVYQNALIKEIEKLKNYGYENTKQTRLGINEIPEKDMQKLRKYGLLVIYPDDTFRTIHGELICRLLKISTTPGSYIPLEFLIDYRELSMPDFDNPDISLNTLLDTLINIIGNRDIAEALTAALSHAGIKGLSIYQYEYIRNILANLLSNKKHYQAFVAAAPVSTGKTLIFFIPALIASALTAQSGKTGVNVLIIYPRRFLASDQLYELIKYVHLFNRELIKRKLKPITIGIDDGQTPSTPKALKRQKEKNFRIPCPIHESEEDKIIYTFNNQGRTLLKCKRGEKYPEVIVTKKEIAENPPHILLSNIYVINRRLMDDYRQHVLRNINLVVFDEIHEYTDEMAAHLYYTFIRLSKINKSKPLFIFASATISEKIDEIKKFIAKRLEGLNISEKSIFAKEFSTRNSKRRLEVYLFLVPHPLRSSETLLEEVVQLVSLWCYVNNMKSIVFIDNVSEVERITDFVSNVIIRDRAEFADHLFFDLKNPYSWVGVMSRHYNVSLIKIYGKELLRPPSGVVKIIYDGNSLTNEELAESIAYHHGELPQDIRQQHEILFKKGKIKVLISTSTLELGVNIKDVAVIVQYKIPPSPQSFIQRVGRGGRTNASLRVALGILVLTNSPTNIRYISMPARRKLFTPTPRLEIPKDNIEIKRYHTLALIYDMLAQRLSNRLSRSATLGLTGWKRPWSMGDGDTIFVKFLRNLQLLKNYIDEIQSEVQSNTSAFQDDITKLTNKIKSLIESIVQDYGSYRNRRMLFNLRGHINSRLNELREVDEKLAFLNSRLAEYKITLKSITEEPISDDLRDIISQVLKIIDEIILLISYFMSD